MNHIEDIVKKTTPIFLENNIKAAYIFGSYARHEEKESSDIDILIDYGDNVLSMFKLANLKYALQEALQKQVDLVCIDALENDYFSKRVHQEKICVWEI